MASEYPPFLNSYGVVQLILAKIRETPIPERFSHEFMSSTMGFRRDADRPFVPLAKRMELIDADGRPTELYKRFRDPDQAQDALMQLVRNAFSQLYARSDDVDALDKKALQLLVADITGLEPAHPTARAVVGTFLAIKTFQPLDNEQTEIPTKPKSRKSILTAREDRAAYVDMAVLQT